MANAAKLGNKVNVSEVLARAAKKSTATTTKVAPTESSQLAEKIKENTYYKIVFDPKTTPKEKVAALTEVQTTVSTKEENRERIAEQQQFKDWMQQKRREWAVSSLALADTEMFSELKSVYAEMNEGVLDFNAKVAPLVEMLQGLNDLRLQGKTLDAFSEVKDDREEDARRARILLEQKERGERLNAEKLQLQHDIAKLSEDKRFLIGGIKKESREQIAIKTLEIANIDDQILSLNAEVKKTQEDFAQPRASSLGDDPKIIAAKQKLRELMDTPAEDLNKMQEELKASVLNFVEKIDAKTTSAAEHLKKHGSQCVGQLDASSKMGTIYALLSDSSKAATDINKQKYETLKAAIAEATTETEKITLEEEMEALQEHLKALNETHRETLTSRGSLAEEKLRVKSMLDANVMEQQKVSEMHNSGNAGMASRLLTVFNGINAAASHEASEMVAGSIGTMRDSTTDLLQRGILANAIGLGEENEKRLRQIAALEESGKILVAAKELTDTNMAAISEANQALERESEALLASIKDLSAAQGAEVKEAGTPAPANTNQPPASTKKAPEPFTFG